MNKIINIGITGSFGFLGSNLIKFIYDFNKSNLHNNTPDATFYNMYCFYSENKNNPLINDINKIESHVFDKNENDYLKLKMLHLNILDVKEVFDKVRNLDVLFHVAGVVDFRNIMKKKVWNVNVLGTKYILDACLQNHIRKVIYISSVNVLGLPAENMEYSDELNTPYNNKDNPNYFKSDSDCLETIQNSIDGNYDFLSNIRICYFDSKLAAFELVKKYNKDKDINIITVFPGTIIGAGDVGNSITDLIVRIFDNRMYFTSSGSTGWVSAQDVARGIFLAYKSGKEKEGYIISGNESNNLNYADFMKLVADVLSERYNKNISKKFWNFKLGFISNGLKLFEKVFKRSKLSYAFLIAGSLNHKFTIEKARKELNYHPIHSLEEAIIDCFEFSKTYKK